MFVEHPVIDAHPQVVRALLLDQHYGCSPWGVRLYDVSSLNELLDSLVGLLALLWGQAAKSILMGLGIGHQVDAMLHQISKSKVILQNKIEDEKFKLEQEQKKLLLQFKDQ